MPLLLDLCSGAGGAAAGYHRAGFEVIGYDIRPKPHYPYEHHVADVIDTLDELLETGLASGRKPDAVHVSPPCQPYSVTRHTHGNVYPMLVEPVRERLERLGLPYVIENVPGAPLRDPVVLCGTMFRLRAIDDDGTELALRRHRLFESNLELVAPAPCDHDGTPVGGVYGGGSHSRAKAGARRGGYTPRAAVAARLLGIDWMNRDELAQSIPPAYTEHLGRQLLAAVLA